MAFGQIDPARLEGDALTRWYLRSPAEIEEARQQAEAKTYDAFFSQGNHVDENASDPSPTIARSADSDQAVVLTQAANSQGPRDRKQDCIEQCTDLTLPTHNYGDDFWRCLHQCMGVNDYPEWRRYFPSPRMTPPRSPVPHQSPVPTRPPSTDIENMFSWLANPPAGPWWLPFALPPFVPNS